MPYTSELSSAFAQPSPPASCTQAVLPQRRSAVALPSNTGHATGVQLNGSNAGERIGSSAAVLKGPQPATREGLHKSTVTAQQTTPTQRNGAARITPPAVATPPGRGGREHRAAG
jgi:hypothetical protein